MFLRSLEFFVHLDGMASTTPVKEWNVVYGLPAKDEQPLLDRGPDARGGVGSYS